MPANAGFSRPPRVRARGPVSLHINVGLTLRKSSSKDPAKELLSAAQICWLYALLPAIPVIFIVAVGDFHRLDPIGTAIVYGAIVYSVLLLMSGTLLYRGKKAGRYVGLVLMVVMLIQIPIGTIAGLLLASNSIDPDVKALLK